MMPNPYAKYQEQSVMTMTHGEMLVKLYDEAIRQIRIAQIALEQKDMVGTNNALKKSQDIVSYLRSTLDFKYEISKQLAQFYDFFSETLVQANIQKKGDKLLDVAALIAELRDAFSQSEKLARMEQQVASGGNAVRFG